MSLLYKELTHLKSINHKDFFYIKRLQQKIDLLPNITQKQWVMGGQLLTAEDFVESYPNQSPPGTPQLYRYPGIIVIGYKSGVFIYDDKEFKTLSEAETEAFKNVKSKL